jgi:hypothetical protein
MGQPDQFAPGSQVPNAYYHLKFQYKHAPRRERRCTASSPGHAVPSPLVGEGEDGGAGGGAPPPHLNPPPPGGRRIADAAGQETRESDRALILEFQCILPCHNQPRRGIGRLH